MEKLIVGTLERCSTVISESYYKVNTNENVTYPYLVFTYDAEALEWNSDGAYVDIDIFDDKGSNFEEIEVKTNEIIEAFRHAIELVDDCLIRYRYSGSNTIETLSDTLQRKSVRLYAKVDWRK